MAARGPMDRQKIARLAADMGYDDPDDLVGVVEAVYRYLASPDQSRTLREGSNLINEAIFDDMKADLYMWIHEMDPEHCECQQCYHMRADLERIKGMHGI